MKILVINCGSSSVKYQLLEMPEGKVIAKGLFEKIGEEISFLHHKSVKGDLEFKQKVANHEEGLNFIMNILIDKEKGVISSINEIRGVGHRVVHGGEGFTKSVLITDEVIKKTEEHIDLAPLHNPANLMGIKASKKILPDVVQVAAFDTAFHYTIPKQAYLYAIPYEFYEKYKIRRYGFHGTSHRYVARRLAKILNKNKEDLNVITCHLGNGCSITAVKEGKSVDTSMGLTPLEGVVMGTRSGDIDPAIIFYLIEKGYSSEELNNILNKKSGLLGISGISNDMRNLLQAKDKGDRKAELAIDIFCYHLKKYIGSYMAVLGRTDAIIFTAGIGDNVPYIRKKSLSGMEELGIEIDEKKNESAKGIESEISGEVSKVKVWVIPTNEEIRMAFDAYEIAKETKK